MTSETKKTIIRHLKGIVAALENDDIQKLVHYKGKILSECTDEEIREVYELSKDPKVEINNVSAIANEVVRRGLINQ